MNDYILIQSVKAKTNLKSACSKSKMYTIQFGDRACRLSHYVESWIATDIQTYSGRQRIARWLRQLFQDIRPDEIDSFLEKFIEEHPLEHTSYGFDLIPLIATEDDCCEMSLSIYKGPVFLTIQQEQQLIQLLQEPYNKFSKFTELENWFENYRRKYGYQTRLKRDQHTQNYELAWGFCVYHGLDVNTIDGMVLRQETKHKPVGIKTRISNIILLSFAVLIYTSIAMLIMQSIGYIENFWLSGIMNLLFWLMICVPLYLFFRKK